MTLEGWPSIEDVKVVGQLDGKRLLMRRDKSVEKERRSLGDIHAKEQ